MRFLRGHGSDTKLVFCFYWPSDVDFTASICTHMNENIFGSLLTKKASISIKKLSIMC